jgi:hypothetical protein
VERENAGDSILRSNQNITNRQHRSRKRTPAHETASSRLRTRKLFQDTTDEADSENNENGANEETAVICWKKKRAALELQRREQHRLTTSSSTDTSFEEDEDLIKNQTRDKLLGALALMELSGVPISTEAVLREAEILMPIAEAEKVLSLYKR